MFCRNIFYIWNCVRMVTNVFTGVASLPLAKHTPVSTDSYGTFLQLQEGVSTLRKIILDSCIRFHDVSTNTGTRLCHSQKQYMHITVREGSNSCSTVIETRLFHSKNALLSEARRTGMTSLWSDSMMTVYNVIQYYWQNSPPQARKFLGFSTVRS